MTHTAVLRKYIRPKATRTMPWHVLALDKGINALGRRVLVSSCGRFEGTVLNADDPIRASKDFDQFEATTDAEVEATDTCAECLAAEARKAKAST